MEDNKVKPKCWLRIHNNEVFDRLDLTDQRGNKIGNVIINRCVNCGKLSSFKVYTTETI